MFVNIPQDQDGWVLALGMMQIPVLQRTVSELARLRENEADIVARDISRVLLHDPMFTLRVLRFLQERRRPGQPTEITTVEHALMMLGLTPFFKHFSDMPAVEHTLAAHPLALEGLMHVVERGRRAALFARDWAVVRHDIESDEVVIAALLHDLAEILLWCFAPQLALQIQDMQVQDRTLRSNTAQRSVLGFALKDLQLALIVEWKLPSLLQSLMHNAHTRTPRAMNVLLATDLARHSAKGWDDPALPDDYAAIQSLLNLPEQEVLERIERTALQADNESSWYHPDGDVERKPTGE